MISFLYFEFRKLRYLQHGFRNYWFGEDMPWLRYRFGDGIARVLHPQVCLCWLRRLWQGIA